MSYDFAFKPFRQMTPNDYATIGFKSGLEIHQQLLTEKKLFCRCPAGRYSSAYHAENLRRIVRSTGWVRTGIGAARQDVNVSVTGGTRIEIKMHPPCPRRQGIHRSSTRPWPRLGKPRRFTGHPAVKADEGSVLESIKVPAKVVVDDPFSDFVANLTVCNNRQNPVEPWNLRANDRIQCDLQDKFKEDMVPPIFNSRQENAFQHLSGEDAEDYQR